MSEYDLMLQTVRLHAKKKDTLVFIGGFKDDNPEGRKICVLLDEQELPLEITIREGLEIRRKYLPYNRNISQEILGEASLPEGWKTSEDLQIVSVSENKRVIVFRLSGAEVQKFAEDIAGNLDYVRIDEDGIHLGGWIAAGEEASFSIYDEEKKLPIEVVRRYRRDALALFPELDQSTELGYEITLPNVLCHTLQFIIKDGDQSKEENIDLKAVRKNKKKADRARNVFVKTLRYCRTYGLKRTSQKVFFRLTGKNIDNTNEAADYELFLKKHQVTAEELERQRKTEFSYQPVFSIVIPLYKTPHDYLKELIESVMGQTYPHWQLCLADGSETKELEDCVREYSNGDPRVCYRFLGYNKGISENTNGAIEIATGDFIAFSDHDDLLTPDALFECARALNQDEEIDCIYSDEDKIDMDGKTLFMPHFKSDFNIDLLCSHNYITHLFVTRSAIVEKVGGLRSEYDGSQDHDMIFRCVEQARKVYHIPKVLYHWRCHKNSTAMNPESKMYCYESGRKAVAAHYERLGIPATVEMAPNYGYFITHYHWAEKPLVSIVIPNMNHADDLKKCIDSIEKRSHYRNFEIIVVENNSDENEIFEYYETLKEKDHITVVTYEGEFNYSKINNFGISHAKGEYLLLLNNDTELIEPNSIQEMLDICMREDVGAVGARLYYADNTIQHAGVILGVGGIANHAFLGEDRGEVGYFFRSVCVQDLSAVTAACMMTKRSVFEEVGGLTEEFAVAFNDVDYCLKIRAKDKLIVFTPFSEWYHYESKSRGYEDTSEKQQRLEQESELFRSRWGELLEKGDPYYNPNFSHERADFLLDLS